MWNSELVVDVADKISSERENLTGLTSGKVNYTAVPVLIQRHQASETAERGRGGG